MSHILEEFARNSGSHLPEAQAMPPFFFEAESLLHNVDAHNIVAPLREVRTTMADGVPFSEETAGKLQGALHLQKQWQAWAAERESLRKETQRGRQCMQETCRDLAALRTRLADWSNFELVCGYNPLPDLVQAIIVRERIEKFLPGWLERRETRLAAVTHKMETCAKENGLEHLL